jgi:hypothetical protein
MQTAWSHLQSCTELAPLQSQVFGLLARKTALAFVRSIRSSAVTVHITLFTQQPQVCVGRTALASCARSVGQLCLYFIDLPGWIVGPELVWYQCQRCSQESYS